MNNIKKYSGIIWVLLGPVAMFYLIRMALQDISVKQSLDTKIQWGVFIGVFIPIAIGMVIFGWYALKGEYEDS